MHTQLIVLSYAEVWCNHHPKHFVLYYAVAFIHGLPEHWTQRVLTHVHDVFLNTAI